ncbi:MAG: RNA repair domain-containing protein [Acidobacteriota bacterium]
MPHWTPAGRPIAAPRLAIKVPLTRIVFETDSHGTFEAIAADGSVHSVPCHRVREAYRDGKLIWRRPEPPLAHRP